MFLDRHTTVMERYNLIKKKEKKRRGRGTPNSMAINGPSHGVLWCYGYSPIDILSWLMLYAELS